MKKLIGIVFIALLSACTAGVPLTVQPSENNNTYNVEYLFEHEGCKIYRFYDRGNYVYFTNCKSDVTSFTNDTIPKRIKNHVRINDLESVSK